MPLVSVLMTTHNAGPHLEPAVRSVLNQTLDDLELLVVDDGSTDASVASILTINDPRLRIERQPRLGLGAPVNQWLDQLDGTYIMRMDADDVIAPERAERQVAHLEANPEVALVGCQYQFFTDRGLGPVSTLPTSHEAITDGLRRGWHTLSHATIMFRRSLMADGLRYSWSGPGEDWSFLSDAAGLGRLAVVDEVLYYYRIHESSSAWVGSSDSVLGLEFARARFEADAAGLPRPDPTSFAAAFRSAPNRRCLQLARSTSAVWYRRAIIASTSGHHARSTILKAVAALLDPRKTIGFLHKRREASRRRR